MQEVLNTNTWITKTLEETREWLLSHQSGTRLSKNDSKLWITNMTAKPKIVYYTEVITSNIAYTN